MPTKIVERAEKILEQLESQRDKSTIGKPQVKPRQTGDDLQLSFIKLEDPVLEQIRDEFLHLDVDNLTPLEALNKLNDLKHIISGK